jgi:iron(III) transport system substrate-binding protein
LEFPVNAKIKPNSIVTAWGDFKQSQINVSQAGSGQADAVILMDKAGYK